MEVIFTEHAKERLQRRDITEEEAISAIKYPDKTSKKEGRYYVQKDIGRAKIEIVYEKDKYIKIITIYYI
ncbi:DUF4258 domain-containing protein [Candidatus Pacearchaeota archaeon]|nr:DUF4258 domain-containing protein [Candidatus Pacearchaeota archaeon]